MKKQPLNTSQQLKDSLSLGKPTDYISHYSPELLQGVPRTLNRQQINLDESQALPFTGYDLWNLYELSWLTPSGLPVVAVAEVKVAASSRCLIESKSFKLYLNSFNQSHFKNFDEVAATLEKDLQHCAEGDVAVKLLPISSEMDSRPIPGINIDQQEISISNYELDPNLLENAADPQQLVNETLNSHLLKSNCLITNQPDWASVYIDYQGSKINQEALLRYLVSFRQHNEFHEQCVERIFCDIMQFCKPSTLTVYARYTRRGGLDINPMRSNDPKVGEKLGNWRLLRQ
ncbi:NADPH-dependent 7-cyano-7-deazaguanine reductase QueF [Agarivorans sp. B2Z047]|uniref:NADPH-dependent 7-cyano-7-deazaguanine reductase QueF n=1 Tax=Agarivorans sp. B2Z047 TaxID=2652721 RepID=UPI00128E6F16|nr:NADPH-dependent 7-cyano-7-deazaguanine reductase QueF [Agarivorans sp. B2Z047]MPW27430.1 NADPH-dependent 7-cyano-7-deazaguanine reductase QueF [Agarivorans sp. B2Z047]UQN44727.1 NADPH-dependent 7-cyano-7-deazaguanine reductase QueF [Agarivorans sp. B2Z047]